MTQVLFWSQVAPNLFKGQLSAKPPSKRSFTYKGKRLPIDSNLLLNLAKGLPVAEGTSAITLEGGTYYAYVYTAYTEPVNLSVYSVAEDAASLGNIPGWMAADGWTNGSPFNVGWRADNVDLTNGLLSLSLTNTPASNTPYSSGEYRTTEFYKYGRYEIEIQPAAGAGLMNGFFTYTGSSDGNPHDEIDTEFAGQDLRILRTNYWVAGVPNEQLIPLNFNAGEAFHSYAFEWFPGTIRWFVDGQKVREVNMSPSTPLPSHAQRVMVNLWSGDESAQSWLGKFNYTQPVAAQFRNFTYIPISDYFTDESDDPIMDESGDTLFI